MRTHATASLCVLVVTYLHAAGPFAVTPYTITDLGALGVLRARRTKRK